MVSETYLVELLKTAAVCEEADYRSGVMSGSSFTGVMRGVATSLAYLKFQNDVVASSDKLMEDARLRAKEIFKDQDWQREKQLYVNLVNRFR